MSSIKSLIEELAPEGEVINPEEFTSLILDDQQLDRALSVEDKKYLEEFKNVEVLSFSNTALKSLANLPDLPELKRIELNSNNLSGDELKHLAKYTNLHTIKFAGNNVTTFAQLDAIKSISLCNLTLSENPISELAGYVEKVFALFADLESLDKKSKEGEELISEDEDDDDFDDDEEGEIDEETRQKLIAQGYNFGADDDDDEEGEFEDDEDGEEDLFAEYDDEDGEDDDEESEDQQPANKR